MDRLCGSVPSCDDQSWRWIVLDAVFLILGVALFGITAAYVSFCDQL
jgi:hypothetical protein